MEGDKKSAQQVWGATPAGSVFGGNAALGTREFFENVLRERSRVEQPWLFELVPFSSFRGKRVLELGCGAGYDAYEISRNGARYTGLDITPENPVRTRSHLAHYELSPEVMVADAESLPFPGARFEVAYSNGVLHHTPDIARSFREVHRVLAPGGEFFVVVYHKGSIFYWLTLWLFDHVLGFGFLGRSFEERLSRIEGTTSDALPLVHVYTRREVRRLLEDAGFRVEAMNVRKLLACDLPGIPLVSRLWRWIPQRWLDVLGKRFGWYVIARARK